MAFDNHAGANKLARTLSERMKNESKGASPTRFWFDQF